jgi:hypothetical protein
LGYRELETSSISTHSSFALNTPNSDQGPPFASEDISEITDMTVDNPAISSMDVELSISTNASEIFGDDAEDYLGSSFQRDIKKVPSNDSTLTKTTTSTGQKTPSNRPSSNTLTYKSSIGPGTPQKRASQVFEFIKKRASKFVEKDERDLPDPPMAAPPSAFSSPSSRNRRLSSSSRSQGRSLGDSEDEVDRQLKYRASSEGSVASGSTSTKGRTSSTMAPPSFVETDLDTTPTAPKESRKLSTRPMSESVQGEGSGMHQFRGLVKRFSVTLGSSTRDTSRALDADQEAEEERDSVPQDLPVIATQQQRPALETPVRPATDADKANQERDIRVLMTGPTKVIVTAPTPGTANHVQTGYSLNRVPRGPRGPNSRRRTSGSSRDAEREERRRIRAERELKQQQRRERGDENRERERERERTRSSKSASGDKYKQGLTTSMISTPMKKVPSLKFSGGRARSSSVSSTGSNGDENHYGAVYAEAKRFVESSHGLGKASKSGAGAGSLGVKSDIPLTPLRTSRRTSVNMGMFDPPAQQENRTAKQEKRSSRDREKGLYALPGSRSGGGSTRNHRL